MEKTRKPPWKKPNPRKASGVKSSKLSPQLREMARERAAKAGRRYPNLIDNMWAAGQAKASRIDPVHLGREWDDDEA